MALGLLLVAGCDESGQIRGIANLSAGNPQAPSAIGVASGDIDPAYVGAPEVYNASGIAKWTGMPTSRGVWVAHPRAGTPRKVRIVNGRTGVRIDGMLFRASRSDDGDVVTVSSEAAEALGLEKDQPTLISLFGLRPKGVQSKTERNQIEARARGDLATRITLMDETNLLRLVAATLRGMGYATVFEPGPKGDQRAAIRAVTPPQAGVQQPSIRAVIRPRTADPADAATISATQAWLAGSGDFGVMVSVAGFTDDAGSGLDTSGPRIELVDLDGLVNIWLTHYEQMSPPDRALLPLQPVYFLAESAR